MIDIPILSSKEYESSMAGLLSFCGILIEKGIFTPEDVDKVCSNHIKILDDLYTFRDASDRILGATIVKMNISDPYYKVLDTDRYNNLDPKKEAIKLQEAAHRIDELSGAKGTLSKNLINAAFDAINKTRISLEKKYKSEEKLKEE